VAAVKIHTGIHAEMPAADVPRSQWPKLILARMGLCHRELRADCRALMFFIEDASHHEWLGYGDRERYIREGLDLDPSMADWAVEGLRLLDGDEAVPLEKAAALGIRARALREQGKSLRAIAKELGKSHQTVRDALTPDTRKRGKPVRLHPDPHRAAGTVIAARGLPYARDLAAAIVAWEGQ
jgi:hypothetical protein